MASTSRPLGRFRDLINKWPSSTTPTTSTSTPTPNHSSSNTNNNNKNLDAERLIPGSLVGSDISDTSSRVSVSDQDAVSNDGAPEPVKPNPRRKRIFLLGLSTVVALVFIALGLGLYFGLKKVSFLPTSTPMKSATPTTTRIHSLVNRKLTHKQGDGLEDGPVVDLGYSRYQGKYLGNDVSQFLGIRYAQSPTGDLRWRAPVDPKQTKRIQSAQTVSYPLSRLSI